MAIRTCYDGVRKAFPNLFDVADCVVDGNHLGIQVKLRSDLFSAVQYIENTKLCWFRSADGAVEIIDRSCILNIEAPYILKKIAGVDTVHFIQKNSLDRRKRTLVIEAHNVSFSNRLVVNEYCVYYVHPDNKEWTCFEQRASLDVKSFFGLESAVEKLAVKQYGANLHKGKEILEFYVGQIFEKEESWSERWAYDEKLPSASSSVADSAIDVCNVRMGEASLGGESSGEVEAEEHEGAGGEKAVVHVAVGRVANKQKESHRRSAVGEVAADERRNADSRLETEYIKRFLGELTPLEESRLCELKYSLQDKHKGKLPNDAHLLRFLRARDFDLAKATDMVLNSIRWRKQHKVDQILSAYKSPDCLVSFFPGCWHAEDLEGRPLFILRLGQLDIKGLLRTVNIDDLVKFTLNICEQGLERTAEATKRLGKPISAWTLLVDLDGLNMRHLWRPGVQALRRIIEIVESNYPETMGRLLVVRAPRVFAVLYTCVGPFIDENTRRKIVLHASGPKEELLSQLANYVNERHIPDFLGGSSSCAASSGGLIPKSRYLPSNAQWHGETDAEDLLQSVYRTAHIYRGHPHELLVPVKSKGSLLTWDFDVVKGQCEFVVYRYRDLISVEHIEALSRRSPLNVLSAAEATEAPAVVGGGHRASHNKPPPLHNIQSVNSHHATAAAVGGGVMSPVEKVAAAFSDSKQPSFVVSFDKSLGREQLDLVERTVFFNEGDSMQGSHCCSFPGTYVLQWKHRESAADGGGSIAGPSSSTVPTASSGPTASEHHFDFSSLTQHKCKIMVCHELIDAVDFRGSMVSLESCKSNLSSLADVNAAAGRSFPSSPQPALAGGLLAADNARQTKDGK